MNNQIDDTPSAEFRAHLEWEISRAIRREARFGGGRRTPRVGRLATVGLMLVCLATGMAVNFASAQVRTSQRRDSLLASAQADLQILMLRLNLAQQESALTEQQASAGVASTTDIAAAQAAVSAAEAQVARAQLGIAEIRKTAMPPRDELTAPQVDGQDYVSDRIRVDLMQAQRGLQAAEAAQAEIERRVRIGLDSSLALTAAQVAAERAQAALSVLAKRLELRQEYLTKGTSADSLAIELHREQVRQELMVTQQQVALAQQRLAALHREQAIGMATDVALTRAQLDLQEHQLEFIRLVQQLQRLVRSTTDTSAKP